MRIIDWVKKNKFTSLLIIVLIYFIYTNWLANSFRNSADNLTYSGVSNRSSMLRVSDGSEPEYLGGINIPYPANQSPPAPEVKDRMIIQESYLSLLVKDAGKAISDIKAKTTGLGGYFVNSNISTPDSGATGQIIIRVPQSYLDETLVFLRRLAVKVVSENLQGNDVTDQYVDNDVRLKILEGNKARFTEIMNKAEKIEDILKVQQELFNIQSQIDSITGQQRYLSKNAQMVKITIYLSTDELSLPYAPVQSFRPDVIFKQAVRSILITLQKLGSLVIWIAVYAVIWIPGVLIILIIQRRRAKNSTLH